MVPDSVADLLDTARSAWRYRWSAVLVAWLIAALGWAGVWLIPNSYEVKARVYVDTDTVLKPLLQGLAVPTDVISDVNMMSTLLMARPNLEKVARETHIDSAVRTPEEFDLLVRSLGRRIALTPGRDSTYTITYVDTDPVMAQRVVAQLLDTFVSDTLGVKRADSSSAQTFLQQQLADYEQKLRIAEDRLADFKKKNVGMMPGEEGDYYTRLQTEQVALDGLRAKLRQVSDRRDELARQLQGEEPTFGIVTTGVGGVGGLSGPYDGKIAELKNRLEQLRVQYTDKHPEVVAIKETIERLEADKKKSAPAPDASSDAQKYASHALDMNPVYQSMKIAVSQAEADLAELRGQIANQEAQVARLRGRIDTIPAVEADLARLNRDYDVNKAQYTQVLQRLESAKISERADQSTDKVKFRIVEAPVVPLLPAGPKRLLLVCGVLIVALGGGLLFALVRNQIKPVVSTSAAFEKLTGVKVLARISRVDGDTPARWYRGEPALVSACAALLVVAFGINVVMAL